MISSERENLPYSGDGERKKMRGRTGAAASRLLPLANGSISSLTTSRGGCSRKTLKDFPLTAGANYEWGLILIIRIRFLATPPNCDAGAGIDIEALMQIIYPDAALQTAKRRRRLECSSRNPCPSSIKGFLNKGKRVCRVSAPLFHARRGKGRENKQAEDVDVNTDGKHASSCKFLVLIRFSTSWQLLELTCQSLRTSFYYRVN